MVRTVPSQVPWSYMTRSVRQEDSRLMLMASHTFIDRFGSIPVIDLVANAITLYDAILCAGPVTFGEKRSLSGQKVIEDLVERERVYR